MKVGVTETAEMKIPSAFIIFGLILPATLATGGCTPALLNQDPTSGEGGELDSATEGAEPEPSASPSPSPATLSISGTAPYDFGSINRKASVDLSFTIVHSAGESAASLSTTEMPTHFSFKGGTYPGTDGTCGSSLNAGETCTLVVTFNPTSGGDIEGTLTVPYSDGVNTQSLAGAMKGHSIAAAQIVGSNLQVCARMTNGTIRCWGDGAYGKLGDGGESPRETPVEVSGISTATDLAMGKDHACALLSDKTIRCWGFGTSGQLGNGEATSSSLPVQVSGITNAVAVAAGGEASFAVLETGEVKSWGKGDSGQLGNGDTIGYALPVSVLNITNATTQISAGANHACAVLADGQLRCWGSNDTGQLGHGGATGPGEKSTSPVTPSVSTLASKVQTRGGLTCALLTDGSAQCWGGNTFGQMGQGSTSANQPTPITLPGILSPLSIAPGLAICVVETDGRVNCWGKDGEGQFGDGGPMTGTETSYTPGQYASDISTAVKVTSATATVCALLQDSSVYCWGKNGFGELGSGNTGTDSSTPIAVSGL